jgi:hypothetical protein
MHPLITNLSLIVRKRKISILWFSVIGAGSILPAAIILASGRTLVWRDTAKLFEPIRFLVVEALGEFHLPLWNPYEALGIPLFAQMMHGVLHPVSVLGAFLFPQAGMDAFILIYILLAALGNAMLARVLGASYGAAAIAGFGYGLSGYVLGMSSIIQYLSAAATAPWALIGLRMAGEGRRRGIVVAAVGTSVLLFAGDPQWTIIAILLGTALVMEAGGIQGLKKASLGLTVGTALAGIQWIPTLMYLRETSRAMELDMVERMQWSLAPWRLIEFIAPGFFGSPGAGLEKWPVFLWLGGQGTPGLEMPFSPSVYVGGGIILLAIAGVLHSRASRIFAISSLILLWLALGTNAGAEQLLHSVPVWGKFRYPEKLVGPLTLCLSILAAFGSERLPDRTSRFWIVLAGSAGLASILAAMFLSKWPGFDTMFTGSVAREAAPHARHHLSIGLVYAGLTLASLSGLIAGATRWSQLRKGFSVFATGLVFLQSALAAPFAMHAGARNILDEFPLLQIKSIGEIPRIATPLERNYLYPKGLNQFDAQIGAQSHLGAPCYNIASRIDQWNTYTGLRPRRFDLLISTINNQFGVQSVLAWRRYAITHMIIKNPYFADETEVALAASEGGVKVLENLEWGFIGWKVPHRPWATFAEQVILVPVEKEAVDAFIDILARGESTVVLEGASPPKGLGSGQVLDVFRGSKRVRIEATSPNVGILVVNDSYWPGWRAKIDGKEVPIWRADYLVRAVPWPSGRHVLEMKYEPREVQIGWLVSGCGAIVLITLLMMDWRRRKIQRRSPG